MILYRIYEINQEFIEVIGIFQDPDIAKKVMRLLPKKEYPYIYGIDTVQISYNSNMLNPLTCPFANI